MAEKNEDGQEDQNDNVEENDQEGGDENEEDVYNEENSNPFQDNDDSSSDMGDGDDSDDSDVSSLYGEDDKKMIKKIASDATNDKMGALERRLEVESFLSDNPEFKPYANKIKAVAQNPNAKNLKIDGIVAAALGTKQLLKIGAEKARVADEKKARSSKSGSSRRSKESSNIPDVSNMSRDEFEELASRVKSGAYT